MLFILSQGVPSVATYVTLPLSQVSAPTPADPLSTYGTPLVGGVTGPESVPLAAAPPQVCLSTMPAPCVLNSVLKSGALFSTVVTRHLQGPSIGGDINGTDGIIPDGNAIAPNSAGANTLSTLNSTTPATVSG